MPIALLLEETTLAIRFGAKQLSPWVHLVAVEELLIDRARSAFLVRWFGTHLPLEGAYLKIVIANVVELRNRYLLAVASAQPELSGPNLAEPLASLAGELAGVLLSPHGMVLTVFAVARKTSGALAMVLKILVSLAAAVIGPAVGGIVIGLGAPAGFLAGLYLGGTKDETTGALLGMLGALARLLESVRAFIELLLGPREKVGNPILRALLDLLDRVAGLVPQLLGFIAFVVVRLGPLLVPLAAQVIAFEALFAATSDTLSFILGDLQAKLALFFDPKSEPTRAIDFVLEQLGLLLPAMVIGFTEFFVNLREIVETIVGRFRPTFDKYLDDVEKAVASALKADPNVVLFDAVLDGLKAAQRSFLATPFSISIHLIFGWDKRITASPSTSSSPSTFPAVPEIDLSKDITSPAAVMKALGPPPAFGDIAKLAKRDLALGGALYGGPLPLSAEALAQIERARHPTSVFAGERKQLEKALGATPKQALQAELESQQQLRDLITSVVGRILPPQLRTYMGTVIGGFRSLDDGLSLDEKKTGSKKPAKVDYPVRELRDNGQLLPVVHRLVVKAVGATRLATEDFEDRLQRQLLLQSYPAPSAV